MDSDETLAMRVQQGDRAAMEALVERYYDPLLRFLFRLCGGNQALAEDMVQETFLRMMGGILSYDAGRPFKPWLYSIAEHIVFNYSARAETRRTMAMVDEAGYPDQRLPMEAQLEAGEMRQSILEGLHQLPIRQREALVLFYYEDLPQKEIAEILNVPVGTIKSRLSLGLKQLRAWIKARL